MRCWKKEKTLLPLFPGTRTPPLSGAPGYRCSRGRGGFCRNGHFYFHPNFFFGKGKYFISPWQPRHLVHGRSLPRRRGGHDDLFRAERPAVGAHPVRAPRAAVAVAGRRGRVQHLRENLLNINSIFFVIKGESVAGDGRTCISELSKLMICSGLVTSPSGVKDCLRAGGDFDLLELELEEFAEGR